MGQYPLPEWFCVCICRWPSVGRGGQHSRGGLLLFLIFRVRVSHWTWSPVVFLDWLANKSQGASHLRLPSSWIVDMHHPSSFFYVGAWVWTQFLMSTWETLCSLNYLPSNFNFHFFKLFSLASTTCYIPRNEGFGCPYVLSRMSQWAISSTNDHAHSHENIFYCCFSS